MDNNSGDGTSASGSIREFIEVDPAKLARQIAQHRNSLDGMPPLEVVRGKDGRLRINDGVTRATRAVKLRPGETVQAEVIQNLPNLDVTKFLKIKDVLP